MKPSTLQREVNRAYRKFYSPKQIMRRFLSGRHLVRFEAYRL